MLNLFRALPKRRTALTLLQGYNFIVLSAITQPDAQPDSAALTATEHAPVDVPQTPLSLALELHAPNDGLALHGGAYTARSFDGIAAELDGLLHSAGVSDLGWRGKILVTGSDRLRWLSGMVSNAVQALPEGQGNYSFLLNVQGRIQGDCWVYRRKADLLLDTSYAQVPALLRQLDHYIIMDDVELTDVSAQWTALSLAGPRAHQVLQTLGCEVPEANAGNAGMFSTSIGEVDCILIQALQAAVSRYELWFAPEHVLAVWETLQAAGAVPCGLESMEALRVLEATPMYGVDLNDRDLPQETSQTRALNFSKGCYLGQEIVERIRSRGKVNRQFRQFTLHGTPTAGLPLDLRSGDQSIGRITTIASLASAGLPEPLALGFVRLEVLERDQAITYDGGYATALAAPPQLPG